MIINQSLRSIAVRRNTLAACVAAAIAAGAAGAAGPHRPDALRTHASSDEAIFGTLNTTPAELPTHPANTITVTNCYDGGLGSLRQAVANAVDGSVIVFSESLPCSTITLTSGAITVDAPNVSVQGPGQDVLTVDGSDSNRVFHAKYGLTISDLTIANGRADNGLGGCIDVVSGDLSLTRSTVTGCHAGDGSNPESRGAGVYVDGNLIMQSSTISASTATASDIAYGGGAYVGGAATLIDSTIAGNAATADSVSARGGGLFVFANVAFHGSRLLDNSASSIDGPAFGGGVAGTTLAVLSTISGNTVYSENKWSYGGGIHNSTSILLVQSTLSGNTASSSCDSCSVMGGGASTLGEIAAYYSAIVDNQALSAASSAGKAYGGGLATYHSGVGGRIVLKESTVSGNSAGGGDNGGLGVGGGIAARFGSPFLVFNSTIAFNQASDFGGGAVGNVAGSDEPVLFSTIVANNQAPSGAGLAPGYPFTLTGSNNLVIASSADVILPADTLFDDPRLQALAPNGGPTKTHALAADSPAINTGINNYPLTYDQRGCPYVREAGAASDIGAFERQTPDYIFRHGFDGNLLICP